MEAIVSMHVNMASIFDACYLSRYRPGYNFPENNATQVKFSNKLWIPCIISNSSSCVKSFRFYTFSAIFVEEFEGKLDRYAPCVILLQIISNYMYYH
jgi:hypothetical protein